MVFKNDSKVIYLADRKVVQLQPGPEQFWSVIDSKYHDSFLTIDGEQSVFKNKGKISALTELYGEELSMYFGAPTVHSQIAFLGSKQTTDINNHPFGTISKLFFEDGYKYFYIYDFANVHFDPGVSNLDILDSLDTYYDPETNEEIEIDKKCIEQMQEELKKLIVRDFFACQTDRHWRNFMFGAKGNMVKVMPFYDYEYSFGIKFINGEDFFKFHFYRPDVIDRIKDDDFFKALLNHGLHLNIKQFFKNIEDRHQIVLSSEDKELATWTINAQKKLVRSYRKSIKL